MGQDLENFEGRGIYSNYFRVGYGAAEVLLDFGRRFEGEEVALLQRIIVTPVHARELARLLETSISGYEERFGEIPEDRGE
jgi:hypothetical protein